ncbi:uncharacterized protein UTRI_00882 [Ustilago trichophora]|uniref:Uncharacterized protein n=1 Tax=Ustilago trichophora TaxID=86804 RepID=A0A5C3DSW8_9BASI|nr:uncharacterized protein UTRI_00882 [Ustilago trichophora]
MKAVLRNKGLLPVARRHVRETQAQIRHVSSSSSASSSSRAAALAKAAEASATASERHAAGGPPIMGPSYSSRQDANRLDSSQHILPDHDDATSHFNLSSSQARRSRAARFGTSRHATYASPLPSSAPEQQAMRASEEDEEEQLALSYAAPTGTSTSSIYLPEYVAWAISQLIAAANDPKLLRADHLKLAHLTDPQEHMAEAAHIPPKRSSLLHLATVSPHRYAAILAVLSEVRQRLSNSSPIQSSSADLEAALPHWAPDTVLDFDCAAGEGLWAAAQVFRQDDDLRGTTSVQRYHGYDRRPNLLKSGKKVAQSSSSNVSPADPPRAQSEVRLKDEGEEIEVDGVTYYEQEPQNADKASEEHLQEEEKEGDQPALEYFSGPKSAMSTVEKTFQSVPLARDLSAAASAGRSLALSAFALSLMTNDSNRFEAVQAMWDSGAEVIVIIDQATPRGFASVASARAQLLELGKQRKGGVHVVAPCSHDKPCPLLHPFAISSTVANAVGVRSDTGNQAKSKDICAFTARYHTPTFLRRTKHSDKGEENVGYSYVVVRRGTRPSLLAEAQRRVSGEVDVLQTVQYLSAEASKTKTGILDMLRNAKKASAERRLLQEVDPSAALTSPSPHYTSPSGGEGEMSDDQAMEELLKLLPEAMQAEITQNSTSSEQLTPEQMDSILSSLRSTLSSPTSTSSSDLQQDLDIAAADESGEISVPAPTFESELAMRLESYSWPRLIKSPLKKGGHVTLDACCASGNIERFTISKASGKQAYQDARKSKWGDLFPHPPRGRSVVKVLNPLTALEWQNASEENGAILEGEDLTEKLVLRAPSKLNGISGGKGKGKGGVQIVGLDEGEDADEILRELFEDIDPFPSSNCRTTTETGKSNVDKGQASYALISPNLITPTKKQTKRININYAKKWNTTASSNKLANTRTNLNTRQNLPASSTTTTTRTTTLEMGEQEADGGFQSSLQSKDTSSRSKVRRSSRKKSRGDWDSELFGR